jgi:glycosyltransferase involved in cell wall biosynthesis
LRLALISDAWAPQVNGVVRTLTQTTDMLRRLGHEVLTVTPDLFKTLPCPTYPEIRLAVSPRGRMTQLLQDFDPGAVHIATEGPLGRAARAWCLRRGLPFSTAYHTRFPEYIRARTGMPLALTYAIMRRFHARSASIMVATASIQAELEQRGFRNINRWSRGVDTALFRPGDRSFLDAPRPIHLYVGRVAVEKNVEAFLGLDLPGTKLVVGDGPQLPALKQRYPGVRFAGARFGEDLARHYAAADVFVFPSRTDTFGLVLLEALASGVPVAAYPVAGPRDVVGGSDVGFLDEDLGAAARRALTIPRERCRAYAMGFSWERSRDQFLANLRPFA